MLEPNDHIIDHVLASIQCQAMISSNHSNKGKCCIFAMLQSVLRYYSESKLITRYDISARAGGDLPHTLGGVLPHMHKFCVRV